MPLPSLRKFAYGFLVAISITACASSGVSPAEKQFVADLIPHHDIGMKLIEDGREKSNDVRLRRLIFEMGDYHHSELHALHLYAQDWGVQPSDEFPGDIHDSQLERLQDLKGSSYDIEWLHLMIEHHEGALEIAGDLLRSGGNNSIMVFARNVIDVQSVEIVEMIRLQKDLCKEGSAC